VCGLDLYSPETLQLRKERIGGKDSIGEMGKEIGRVVEKKKVSSDTRARVVSNAQRRKLRRARVRAVGPATGLAGLGPRREAGRKRETTTRAGASGPRAMVGCG
jgi:hypothetical protein